MSLEKATQHLEKYHLADRIMTFEVSSATVELAAAAVGTEPGQIAKSLTYLVEDQPIMILAAGDSRIDNSKYKQFFHKKAKMLTSEQVECMIGHSIGGVCPFGINDGVDVYLDESLKKYDIVYPACGTAASAVKLSIEELELTSCFKSWIDVTK